MAVIETVRNRQLLVNESVNFAKSGTSYIFLGGSMAAIQLDLSVALVAKAKEPKQSKTPSAMSEAASSAAQVMSQK